MGITKRYFTGIVLLLITVLLGCYGDGSHKKRHIAKEPMVESVFDREVLRAAIENNSSSYFVFKGTPMGYHYDLLSRYAQEHNLKLQLIVCQTPDEAIELLEAGACDVAAMNLAIFGERAKRIQFTTPLRESHQVLVQRRPHNWRRLYTAEGIEQSLIREPLGLAGKTVVVPEGSSYVLRLENIMEEIGDTIYIEKVQKNEEELFEDVAKGLIDYTVCDDNIATLNGRYYSDIDSKTPVSFKQKVAWGVNLRDTALCSSLNTFFEKFLKTTEATVLFNKYYRYPIACRMARASEHSQGTGGSITPWDDVLKQACEEHRLDWPLVASVIYQESKFNPEARSPKGAMGLMQMIPETMGRYGVDSLSTPEEHIVAGIAYLAYLNKQFEKSVSDSTERCKFMLAAYNAGLGHIYDAQRLAKSAGKNPELWDDVAVCILDKSNSEFCRNNDDVRHGFCRGDMIVGYVQEVLERYEHYKTVFLI